MITIITSKNRAYLVIFSPSSPVPRFSCCCSCSSSSFSPRISWFTKPLQSISVAGSWTLPVAGLAHDNNRCSILHLRHCCLRAETINPVRLHTMRLSLTIPRAHSKGICRLWLEQEQPSNNIGSWSYFMLPKDHLDDATGPHHHELRLLDYGFRL